MTASTLEVTLIAARALFLIFSFVLAAVALTRWRGAIRAHSELVTEQHSIVLQRLADLEARVDATNLSLSKLGERVERPQQLTSQVAAPSPGYQIAIRLAKGGASVEELISGCGLSIHEAELVHRLHAPQTRASARKQPAQRPHAA
jgi:hypothetical protein